MNLVFNCRLELKGDRNVLGEFIEFKGKQEDMHALRNVKRSKVCRLVIQKSSLFGGLGKFHSFKLDFVLKLANGKITK